jgi:hypothetical protein
MLPLRSAGLSGGQPPQLQIASPTNHETTAVPQLQVAGLANETLQSLTCDVSNAVSVLTNQAGILTGRDYWDTNLLAYTTNWFQCYDLELTNSLNLITVHAMDLAGKPGCRLQYPAAIKTTGLTKLNGPY